MSTTKHTTIEQLKKLALRTKNEIGLVDAKMGLPVPRSTF